MGIETSADSQLWGVVSKTYEERNYTAAILESIQYLGDIIREKSGLSSDGMSLVGEAFGGAKPKLRVNRFETETDKNVQGGIEHLVRGLYKAFRNPRSHEKHVDSQEDADAVLLLTSYLLKVIGQAKSPFERTSFLKRVFDPEFVKSSRYAKLLAAEVPAKYQFDVLVEIFRTRDTGHGDRLTYMTNALWLLLSEDAKTEFSLIVSEELNILDKADLISTIRILPTEIWPKCSEAARIRTETLIIESIKDGHYDAKKSKCLSGSLGTWATNIIPNFILETELHSAVASRLEANYSQAFDYISKYLFPAIYLQYPKPTFYMRKVLRQGLAAGDVRFKELTSFINQKKFDDENFVDLDEYQYPQWREALIEAFEKFIEVSREDEDEDDIPF